MTIEPARSILSRETPTYMVVQFGSRDSVVSGRRPHAVLVPCWRGLYSLSDVIPSWSMRLLRRPQKQALRKISKNNSPKPYHDAASLCGLTAEACSLALAF